MKKFKIQVGEPALNEHVLGVLEEIAKYENLIPSISTVALRGYEKFFEGLLKIKKRRGRFQLQFSIHSTDETQGDQIIPISK